MKSKTLANLASLLLILLMLARFARGGDLVEAAKRGEEAIRKSLRPGQLFKRAPEPIQ